VSESAHPEHHRARHPDGGPEAHRAPLPPGAGAGKVLLLDTFSGIAGDMTVAALVDLGVPFQLVCEAVGALQLPGVRLELEHARAGAVGALRLEVLAEQPQPERSWQQIDELLQRSALSPTVAELARRIFRRLAEAESRVHRVAVEQVHFHEVGAVDTIADIVGAAACFEHLGAVVVSTPMPMGRGMITCRHGPLPLPAPAVLECLRDVPTYDSGIDAELVTPTGAAIATTVVREYTSWPSFAPERIGWGAGRRTYPDRPNALRVVLGANAARSDVDLTHSHVLLEATVDDMTGELAAHAIKALLAGGARDAWAVPITMKKGRPGLILAALADRELADALAELMLRETSTMGLRFLSVGRLERPRHTLEVMTRFGPIPVKVGHGPYAAPQLKPEFDACVRAARTHGVAVREVLGEALCAARQQCG
jgi:uncharacterized protein (TIGR00299 family) protein